MLLRSGRATSVLGPRRRRSAGSTLSRGSDEAVGAGRARGLKRNKPTVKVEASLPRKFMSKSMPASLDKQAQTPAGLHPAEVGGEAPLSPTEAAVSAAQGTTDGDDSSDEASVAELGVKLFPSISPVTAAAIWVGLVNNAKACIKHYNNKHQANFVYKHAPCNGCTYVEEQDGGMYFHINFMAQDKKGDSQLFFGEIEEQDTPKEEDVTCCCPVSPSAAGGKNNVEEAGKREFPMWGTAGMDQEHCYACLPRMKHPEGICYVAGHYADTRQYDGF